jgi:hypothetical protein
MLMQEAEVRSSAGQHVRSHSSKNVAVFLKCVRPQKSTASLSGVRARTQVRGARTQARAVLARRSAVLARSSAVPARRSAVLAHSRAVLARRCANVLEEAAVRSTALSMPDFPDTQTES